MYLYVSYAYAFEYPESGTLEVLLHLAHFCALDNSGKTFHAEEAVQPLNIPFT